MGIQDEVFILYRRTSHDTALRRAVANALRETAQRIDGCASSDGSVPARRPELEIAIPHVLRIDVEIVQFDEYNVHVTIAERLHS